MNIVICEAIIAMNCSAYLIFGTDRIP